MTESARPDQDQEDRFLVDEAAHTAYRLAGVVRMGRAPENTIVITDPTVSRLHCEVWPDGEHVMLRSLGSNGTRINGNRVPGTWELEEGDRVDVGWSSFLFTSQRLPLGIHPASRGIASAARRSAAEPAQVASSDHRRDTVLVSATAPALKPVDGGKGHAAGNSPRALIVSGIIGLAAVAAIMLLLL